jgi:hypothetical protein
MTNKWKTFGELMFLAIVSFPAFNYLGISVHSVDSSLTLHYFDMASIIAPIVFGVIAVFAAIFG